MSKENLILVHSFPTNSMLLSGLTEYLSDYLEVYPVDLPGFAKTVPPLAEISLDRYAKVVEEQIEEMGLEHYWLAGVSFGFAVVNRVQPDPRCRGFIAMEPYLGPVSLRMGIWQRLFYALCCQSIASLKLSSIVWSSNLFRKALVKLRNCPPEQVEILFEHIDGRTFFETAALIFNSREQGCFSRAQPYILIANKDDQTLDYDYTLRMFTQNTDRLLVVNTTIDHYPRDSSPAYFREQLSEGMVRRIQDFMAHPVAIPDALPLQRRSVGGVTSLPSLS
jgi:pimeloyl-ACP methyl ester carboxylesterase